MAVKRSIIFFIAILISYHAFSKSVEHMVWDRTPLRITLPIKEERLIRFPLAVKIVDSELDKSVRITKAQDCLYLNAQVPMVNKRLVVQLMPEGEAIILSISAKPEATNKNTIEVVMSDEEDESNEEAVNHQVSTQNTEINPISLTRFAIQSLYSPERLLVTPQGVRRAAMRTFRNITLVYGASISARPIISWQGADLYVTAVELKNELNREVIVNPQSILGDWQTASFYPTNTLKARGGQDKTTVFLTSSKPFGEALAENREFVR